MLRYDLLNPKFQGLFTIPFIFQNEEIKAQRFGNILKVTELENVA